MKCPECGAPLELRWQTAHLAPAAIVGYESWMCGRCPWESDRWQVVRPITESTAVPKVDKE